MYLSGFRWEHWTASTVGALPRDAQDDPAGSVVRSGTQTAPRRAPPLPSPGTASFGGGNRSANTQLQHNERDKFSDGGITGSVTST